MPESKFVEATQSIKGEGFPNWGKFLLMRFTPEEWAYRSRLPVPEEIAAVVPAASTRPLLAAIGTNRDCIWVLDLQTHEGASFKPGGLATADLNKHRIWVCPLFEPFLHYLYKLKRPFEDCPALVELPDAEGALYGYRRAGPEGAQP